MKSNRRSFLALAGVSALGAANLRTVAAEEIPVSNGDEESLLSFSDPWVWKGISQVEPLVSTVVLESGQATLVVGSFGTPIAIDDWIKLELASHDTDVTKVPEVAGGSSSFLDTDGAESVAERRVHLDVATQRGFLYEVVDQLWQTMLVAPMAEFAATVASVQAAVALDGTPVLADMDGAEIQAALEAGPPKVGGEYIDETGNLHVTWVAGWTVVSQNEAGIELANPEQSVVLAVQVVAFEGRTWEEEAQVTSDWLMDDQGPYGNITTPVVTETGFTFATDGDHGLRLVQGTATENDLDHYILTYAGNMAVKGAEAQPILQQIQADVTINGQAPLQGLDVFINISAT